MAEKASAVKLFHRRVIYGWAIISLAAWLNTLYARRHSGPLSAISAAAKQTEGVPY
jgi:hypothetical protein